VVIRPKIRPSGSMDVRTDKQKNLVIAIRAASIIGIVLETVSDRRGHDVLAGKF
jgi:hypothetical protein